MATIMGSHSKVFEHAVASVILANAAILVWGVVDHAHHELAERIETACLVFFVFELALRLRARPARKRAQNVLTRRSVARTFGSENASTSAYAPGSVEPLSGLN
jgi:hypothetical protein